MNAKLKWTVAVTSLNTVPQIVGNAPGSLSNPLLHSQDRKGLLLELSLDPLLPPLQSQKDMVDDINNV